MDIIIQGIDNESVLLLMNGYIQVIKYLEHFLVNWIIQTKPNIKLFRTYHNLFPLYSFTFAISPNVCATT